MATNLFDEIIDNFLRNGEQPVTFSAQELDSEDFLLFEESLAVTTHKRYRAYLHDKSTPPLHMRNIEDLAEGAYFRGVEVSVTDDNKVHLAKDLEVTFADEYGEGGFCAS